MSNLKIVWNTINWTLVRRRVSKYQRRIFEASLNSDVHKVHGLQKRLINSLDAKLLSVLRVTTENKGRTIEGVDRKLYLTAEEKSKLVKKIRLDGKASPISRADIPKPGMNARRALGIPFVEDRAKQTLLLLALEPEWEAKFESNSYGFRPGRSCHHAIEAVYLSTRNYRHSPNFQHWVLDADLKGCFDKINHDYLLNKLATLPEIRAQVEAWLKAGIFEGYLTPRTRVPNKVRTKADIRAEVPVTNLNKVLVTNPSICYQPERSSDQLKVAPCCKVALYSAKGQAKRSRKCDLNKSQVSKSQVSKSLICLPLRIEDSPNICQPLRIEDSPNICNKAQLCRHKGRLRTGYESKIRQTKGRSEASLVEDSLPALSLDEIKIPEQGSGCRRFAIGKKPTAAVPSELLAKLRQQSAALQATALKSEGLKQLQPTGESKMSAKLRFAAEGASQGDVISPFLANVALHGMENHLKDWICTKPSFTSNRGRRAKRMDLAVIRYAYDLVIIHSNRDILLEAKVELESWLSNTSQLQLNQDKTKILSLREGFNFLGFTIISVARDGMSRTKIFPSSKAQLKLLSKTRNIIQTHRNVSSYVLISKLRPIILGWGNYYRYSECKEAFHRMTHFIFQQLRAWVFRRDRRHGQTKVKQKYFPSGKTFSFDGSLHQDNWILCGQEKDKSGILRQNYLPHLVWLKSRKFTKVKSNAWQNKGLRNEVSPTVANRRFAKH